MGLGTIGIFVQVRLGSQRLPRKALLPLGGTTLIQQVMASLQGAGSGVRALLTDPDSAPQLEEPARRGGFELFVGPAEDVVARYVQAAGRYGVETIVRATGDSPLVSSALIRSILREHERAAADLSHYLGCPLGTGVEVIRSEALREIHGIALSSHEREHITTHFYRHPDRYRIHEPTVDKTCRYRDANVSVDTALDYERVKAIFADLGGGGPIEVGEVVGWLRDHPDQVSLMRIVY